MCRLSYVCGCGVRSHMCGCALFECSSIRSSRWIDVALSHGIHSDTASPSAKRRKVSRSFNPPFAVAPYHRMVARSSGRVGPRSTSSSISVIYTLTFTVYFRLRLRRPTRPDSGHRSGPRVTGVLAVPVTAVHYSTVYDVYEYRTFTVVRFYLTRL